MDSPMKLSLSLLIHNLEKFVELPKPSWVSFTEGKSTRAFSILLAPSVQILTSLCLCIILAEHSLIKAPYVSGTEPQLHTHTHTLTLTLPPTPFSQVAARNPRGLVTLGGGTDRAHCVSFTPWSLLGSFTKNPNICSHKPGSITSS